MNLHRLVGGNRTLAARLGALAILTIMVGFAVTLNVHAVLPSTVAVISVGDTPNAIAVNPLTNMVYVVDGSDNRVTIINGATNLAVGNVSVGDTPNAIALDPSAHM
ncbi:MAG: hypothetical protein ABR867_05100, partial [Nitrososphaerales archaeon]